MPFSADAWQRNLARYETIRDMPFNVELGEGTLDVAAFKRYIIDDAHYLIAFGQTLAVAAAKAWEPDDIVQFSEAAKNAVIVERALHESYFRSFGITAADFSATPPSPTCHHYTNYLLATGFREPIEVVLGAVLPCFWIYAEVGRAIHARARTQLPDGRPNPYQAWIDTYAGEEFHEVVRAVIATTDRVAANASPAILADMHKAFAKATELEWMFWDGAWTGKGWRF
jgi:thiaminase/transcriptional activator TenA